MWEKRILFTTVLVFAGATCFAGEMLLWNGFEGLTASGYFRYGSRSGFGWETAFPKAMP